MKRLLYQMPSGQIRIIVPAEGKDLDYVRQVTEQKNPTLAGNFVKIIEHTDIPQSREFRDQWRMNGGSIEVDSTLETQERWKRVRAERNKRIQESDGKILRAQEVDQAKVDQWKTYRQALRDVTNQPDPKNITWPQEP